MKLLVLLFSLIIVQNCFAQIKTIKLEKTAIPENVKYSGDYVEATSWVDGAGKHIVLLTADNITQSNTDNGERDNNAALYAFHYLVSGSNVKQLWKIYDYVKDCPVDIDLYFIDKTLRVTDLNKDGKAEIWIMYKNSCHGDVSPVPMKIIMYEDNRKFAVRGSTKVKVSETEYIGGEFVFDSAFKKAPTVFRQYAADLWKQHILETWGQ